MGQSPVAGSHDRLVIRGQHVTWYEGLDPATSTVRKVYGVETPILQAFWCRFSAEEGCGLGGGEEGCGCVCIREQECLGIYMESGAIHYVPFPFQASHVT